MARTVVSRCQPRLRDCHADAVRKTLPERTGGGLHARRMAIFRMTRRLAAPLPEVLDLIQREIVAGQVKQAVEKHGAVPCAQHESVAIAPMRIFWIVPEVLHPKRVSH